MVSIKVELVTVVPQLVVVPYLTIEFEAWFVVQVTTSDVEVIDPTWTFKITDATGGAGVAFSIAITCPSRRIYSFAGIVGINSAPER